MIKGIVAIVLLLGLGSSHRDHEQARQSTGYQLEVPFTISKGGTLIVGPEGEAGGMPRMSLSPIERWEVLDLVLPNETIQIETLDQLYGRVQIRSRREALAFCRLGTSPKTYYLLLNKATMISELEIVSNDEVDSDFMFGDEHYAKGCRVSDKLSGYRGIVSSRKKLDEMGITPTEVHKTAEGYEVRRTLMVDNHNTGRKHMERVVEVVGYDGSYARTESHMSDLPVYFTNKEAKRDVMIDKIVKIMETCPPWGEFQGDEETEKIMASMKELSKYDLDLLREAITRYLSRPENKLSASGWGRPARARVHVLDRYIFDVPAGKVPRGSVRGFGGFFGMPWDSTGIDVLWPLSVDAQGNLVLTGRSYGYSGPPLFGVTGIRLFQDEIWG